MRDPELLPTKSVCPYCGYVADSAICSNRPGARPVAGSFDVCINCAGVSVYQADYSRLKLDPKAFSELPIDAQNNLYEAIITVRQVNAKKKP